METKNILNEPCLMLNVRAATLDDMAKLKQLADEFPEDYTGPRGKAFVVIQVVHAKTFQPGTVYAVPGTNEWVVVWRAIEDIE